MRQFLPPVIAFLIACAGSSGTVIMRATLAHRADSAAAPIAADTAARHDEDPDSLGVPAHDTSAHATDSVAAPRLPVASLSATDTTTQKVADTAAKPVVVVPPPTRASVTPSLMPDGRLAKLFAAMPARDAAKVFDQMTDGDVISLLGEMSDKRAAEVLALLPPVRSAVIAKAVLARSRSS